jgi:hypothetical protein
MRTCPKCGCYVPDNWITCPACDVRVKIDKEALVPRPCYNITSKVFHEGVYRVKIYYRDNTMTDTIFCEYENALKHAQNTIDKFWYCVQFIEVWDCQTHARIGLFYPNS